MQFIKILFWVLLLVATFIFWWTNEARSSLDLGAAVVEARVSTFVVGAFLIGFVPTWLLLRGSKWRLSRRIKTLEDAARPAVVPTPPASRTPAPAAAAKAEPAPAVSSVSTDKATGL
ncbi:LapA family protein [uncultured Parasphingorhabdus sp.]|uniref:LapA family protein n=1 Tax=uncultured Parasphingorhabdus sp. TaxID=2709694 RepID=UPI0030DB98CA|tara:strand:+ start:82821 stop:83171 length:351 start_codon:yes stop_codon:yes gene_type:complete